MGALTVSLRELAAALGGDVANLQVLAPGPGHSRGDRSMCVRLHADARDGFMVTSFAGDDWRACRDYVKDRLRLPDTPPPAREMPRRSPRTPVTERDTKRLALAAWDEAHDPRGTIVEAYLAGRGLELPPEVAGEAIRFHPACAFKGARQPCMIALYREIVGDRPVAVHRTALTPEGAKIDRGMLGPFAGAAIKIDADAHVAAGLTIGEGIETVLAGRQLGFRPGWALGSSGAIAAFPVLPGVEALTILAEHDAASAKAVQACGRRWSEAGREVLVVRPRTGLGSDVNDALRAVA